MAGKKLFKEAKRGQVNNTFVAGYGFDLLARITGKSFAVSSIRIKKFCATTQFDTSISKKTDFTPPVSLQEGLERTIQHEFLEDNASNELFYTE